MTAQNDIEETIKTYILGEFLPDEDPGQLAYDTPLMSTGILDSVATLKLVGFLEEKFSISLAAHETDAEHMDTIQLIAALVRGKR